MLEGARSVFCSILMLTAQEAVQAKAWFDFGERLQVTDLGTTQVTLDGKVTERSVVELNGYVSEPLQNGRYQITRVRYRLPMWDRQISRESNTVILSKEAWMDQPTLRADVQTRTRVRELSGILQSEGRNFEFYEKLTLSAEPEPTWNAVYWRERDILPNYREHARIDEGTGEVAFKKIRTPGDSY